MHKNKDSRVYPAACTSIIRCPPQSHLIPCHRLRCQRQSRARPPSLPPLPASPDSSTPSLLLLPLSRRLLSRRRPPPHRPPPPLCRLVRPHCIRLLTGPPPPLLPPPLTLPSCRCLHRRLCHQRQSHAHPPPPPPLPPPLLIIRPPCATAMADADPTASSSSEAIIDIDDILTPLYLLLGLGWVGLFSGRHL